MRPRPPPKPPGRRAAGRRAHAASSPSWEVTISRYSGQRLQKLLVRSHAHDPPVVEHDDPVGMQDRAHPLRDDQNRRVLGLGPQRGAELGVGRRVERRETVVEQVDGRVASRAPWQSTSR